MIGRGVSELGMGYDRRGDQEYGEVVCGLFGVWMFGMQSQAVVAVKLRSGDLGGCLAGITE